MIIITGASKGIGKYLFERFKKEGQAVIGTYNSSNKTNDNNMYKLNITDESEVIAFFDKISAQLKKNVIINCAGINYTALAHKSNIVEWANVVNVNLVGTFNIIHHILPFMREEGYGRIINLSSVVARLSIPGTSAYAASKSGLWGLSRSIAAENAKKGITINTLNLGYFNIGMIAEVSETFKVEIKNKIPMGDFGKPENIYNCIQFLLNSDYVTGSEIDINGGII
jgi:NAD(P)-dependent dehydrogenase (short-subunit alcohol dehydrogenase family)